MFWPVVLEKTLESPLDYKEIKPVNPKGNQSWIFIGRTDDEAEIPKHWSADAKNPLTGKNPDAGKDWRQEEKGQNRMRCLNGITDAMEMNLSRPWKLVMDRDTWCAAVYGVTSLSDMTKWLNWTVNWYFWIVVLEKILECPLHCKIKSVNPKGKGPDAVKDWR